jgi:hypothetical protein
MNVLEKIQNLLSRKKESKIPRIHIDITGPPLEPGGIRKPIPHLTRIRKSIFNADGTINKTLPCGMPYKTHPDKPDFILDGYLKFKKMHNLEPDDELSKNGWEQFFKWFKLFYLREV